MRKSTDSNARRNSKKTTPCKEPPVVVANHKRHIARHRKSQTPHRPPSQITNPTSPAIANHKRHIARHRKSQTPHWPPTRTTNTTWPDGHALFLLTPATAATHACASANRGGARRGALGGRRGS